MHVLEEYRGKGIGTKLVNDFFKWCHEKGVTVVKVSASAPNSQGIKFYRKLGFNDYSLILERSMDT